MQKNVANQKWVCFAFDSTTGLPKTGDALNITANLRLDGGVANPVDDTNPAELEGGYYAFDITQAESNADMIVICPSSVTANIVVVGVPGAVWTESDFTATMKASLDAATPAVTVSDKAGFSLSATGADLILKSSAFIQAMVAAVNEFATYGLTALNALLVTTGIKTASTAAPTDMALNSTVAKETTLATVTGYIDTEIAAILEDTGTTLPATLAAIKVNTDLINAGGALVWTYTITDSVTSLPIPDVSVRLTSNSAGTVTLRTATTNSLGVATFYFDSTDSGMTVYVWRRKAGYDFSDPDSEVLS